MNEFILSAVYAIIRCMSSVRKVVANIYHKTHWFTDKEAWMLYRIFAFTEAIGWTLLISAIIYRRFDLPLADIFVSIAGTVHGVFFMLYFTFVLITARSMLWGFWRVLGAIFAGMPPYTSLAYEKLMAYHRTKYPFDVPPPADLD
jgi:integral membrane protein